MSAEQSRAVITATLRAWPMPEPGEAHSTGSRHDRGHVLAIGGARPTPCAVGFLARELLDELALVMTELNA